MFVSSAMASQVRAGFIEGFKGPLTYCLVHYTFCAHNFLLSQVRCKADVGKTQ